jgi:DNA polymerase III epsilon subunit-like protein
VLLVDWNVHYDRHVILKEFHRAKLEWSPLWRWGELTYVAKYLEPGLSSYSLTSFVERFQWSPQTHRALKDCQCSLQVIEQLLKEKMNVSNGWSQRDQFLFALELCFSPSDSSSFPSIDNMLKLEQDRLSKKRKQKEIRQTSGKRTKST